MLKPKPALDENGRFQTGNIGGGRQKGSRNKLGEEFIADLYATWQSRGVEVINKVIETRPADFLKVVASILPQQLKVSVSPFEDMTETELNATLKRLMADPDIIALDARLREEIEHDARLGDGRVN